MKALIIILVLVAVSFVGLLVYGKAHGSSGHQQGQPAGFGAATDPKPDQLDSWNPPSFASGLPWFQERFGPSLGLKPSAQLTNTPLVAGSLQVPAMKGAVPGKPDPKNVRLAKISLVGGEAALLEQGDNRLCLCAARSALPDALFTDEACDTHWKTKNASRTCEPDQTSGSIPVGDQGGTIRLMPGPHASVIVK